MLARFLIGLGEFTIFMLHCNPQWWQDYEKLEEERSDFLKDRLLKYVDVCVSVDEKSAQVSGWGMTGWDRCLVSSQPTLLSSPNCVVTVAFKTGYYVVFLSDTHYPTCTYARGVVISLSDSCCHGSCQHKTGLPGTSASCRLVEIENGKTGLP